MPAVGAHRHGTHPPRCPVSAEPPPGSRSQTATVWSSEPETMCRPSGVTATEYLPSMPGELAEPLPGSRSQTATVRRLSRRRASARRGSPPRKSPPLMPGEDSHECGGFADVRQRSDQGRSSEFVESASAWAAKDDSPRVPARNRTCWAK